MDDTISRQGAIDVLRAMQTYKLFEGDDMLLIDQAEAQIELMRLPSAQQYVTVTSNTMVSDTVKIPVMDGTTERFPSAQPEWLTDDDFETIKIHLNAYKEKLCNQQRWQEAGEYQRIIDRFMAFASAQPEPRWIPVEERLPDLGFVVWVTLVICGRNIVTKGQWDGVKWIYPKSRAKITLKVTAWMPNPIPKPYKRSEDE